ncbi:MAG: dehydrogenase, partial [Bacteroidetes bacterium]|nr:dehydrogenase [Bacteroidota bacterium]
HGEIFDHHSVEYTYADGSILTSQCRHIPGTSSKVDELFIGTKGKIFCNAAKIVDFKGNTLFQYAKKGKNLEKDPYQTEHEELFAAIAKGEYKFADAENGAKSTMTSILGRMATYSGQVIDWDKAINSGIDIHPKVYAWDAPTPTNPGPDGFYPIAVPGVTKYF